MRFFKFLGAFTVVLGVVWAFLFFVENDESATQNIDKVSADNVNVNTEKTVPLQGVWLTYTEIAELVKGKSLEAYREAVDEMMSDFKETGINTVFYHGRAFCDSLYASDIFPLSKHLTSEDEGELPYDPLQEFLNISQKYGVSVHLWLNPYRVSYDTNYEKLPDNSPSRALYEKDKKSLIICDKGIYLNPACSEARRLVLDGVKEALEKYNVDGIHFDDYFYPSGGDLGDGELYKQYKKQGGTLTITQWRQENVNSLVSSVYSLVKARSQELIFSISPAADIEKCTDVFCADVKKWASTQGYVDYLIPQIYFGFENSQAPFGEVTEEWEALASEGNVGLVCGLGAYKCGKTDENAAGGKSEWTENQDILARQYEVLQKSGKWKGFALFSYSYCFGDNMNHISEKEIKNLANMVK